MIIERHNNEILIRFDVGSNANNIQAILDYLRYKELTSKSTATKDDVEDLLKTAKSGRWNKIKKEKGL